MPECANCHYGAQAGRCSFVQNSQAHAPSSTTDFHPSSLAPQVDVLLPAHNSEPPPQSSPASFNPSSPASRPQATAPHPVCGLTSAPTTSSEFIPRFSQDTGLNARVIDRLLHIMLANRNSWRPLKSWRERKSWS
jgi:hypothetical protein